MGQGLRLGNGLVVLAMMVLAALPAAACDGLRDGPKGTVGSVVDGDTLILDNGLVVRLVGIQAPHLALGRDGLSDWPKGEDAKAQLERIALGQKVLLRYGGAEKDRHGRLLAQVYFTESSGWVQQQMLNAGMARVYSFPDNRSCMAELYAAEGKARLAKLGIWADPYYTVRRAERPADFASLAGHFELVEGRVLAAQKTGGRVYLNFGRRFTEDFTAVIDQKALRLFADDQRDPLRLAGALVRVRGWVDLAAGGPRIDISHPEQIEVLAVP